MKYTASITAAMAGIGLTTKDRRFMVPCPPGAGGRAPAPKAVDRRKKRKVQKLARRTNRR